MHELDKIDLNIPPYNRFAAHPIFHFFAAVIGACIGFAVFWFFYQVTLIAVIGAIVVMPIAVNINIKRTKQQRLQRLLTQFKDMLESLVVALQAGVVDLAAFEHALSAMRMTYSDSADIVKELNLIIEKFKNRVSLGEGLTDFANRCTLEDVRLFATVYSSIEGKADKTQDIVERAQKVLSDKISIQAEIKTLSSGAVMEINIMVFMPVLIVAVMGFMGGELMEALFSGLGHVAATVAILIFAGAYALGRRIVNIKM